jgi:hypothetical protein
MALRSRSAIILAFQNLDPEGCSVCVLHHFCRLIFLREGTWRFSHADGSAGVAVIATCSPLE